MRFIVTLTFLIFSLSALAEIAPSTFSSEMDFLKKASQKIQLYLPTEKIEVTAAEDAFIEDSISTGQAAPKREENLTASKLLEEMENEEKVTKPLLRRR